MEKGYFAHETAVIDDGCLIGEGSKIWHFSHIMSNSNIGKNCNIGQNVVISPDVILGDNVKVQNNVSIYTGVICEDDVFLGPSMVFTNIINPRKTLLPPTAITPIMLRKVIAKAPPASNKSDTAANPDFHFKRTPANIA